MLRSPIPTFCLPCIERLQAQCPHLHTSFLGGLHLIAGEVWDDITEACDDCGAYLDELSQQFDPLPEEEEISIQEKPLCEL
jgi:hypothetical protein